MDKLDVAIICSAIPARKELLKRSLVTWDNSILSSGLNAKIFLYLENKEGWNDFYPYEFVADQFLGDIKLADRSGTHVTGYNFWLDEYKVDADVYIFTHGEILFPFDTILTAYQEAIKGNVFAAFKVFWLPQGMSLHLDKYAWKQPELLEREIALYPKYSNEHGDWYWNGDVRDKTEWRSTTTFAIDSELAHKIYPMPNLFHQGFDDTLHYQVRRLLNTEDKCIMNPILMHQWHEQTWDQNSQQAVEEAIKLRDEYYIPLFKEKGWI